MKKYYCAICGDVVEGSMVYEVNLSHWDDVQGFGGSHGKHQICAGCYNDIFAKIKSFPKYDGYPALYHCTDPVCMSYGHGNETYSQGELYCPHCGKRLTKIKKKRTKE